MKSLNGKSDLLRFAILLEFGGVYVDADSVSVGSKNLNPILKEVQSKFFAAWEDHPGTPQKTVAGGVCGAPPENTVVRNIIHSQKERFDNNPDNPPWQTVGPHAVHEGVKASNKSHYKILPSSYFYPEWWHHYSKHFVQVPRKFPKSLGCRFDLGLKLYTFPA